MHLYPAAVAQSLLTAADGADVARLLHNSYRAASNKRESVAALDRFADTLMEDLQKQELPPSPATCMHIISFLKEAKLLGKARQFWSWVVEQDESLVDAKVYSAAIEMMAVDGEPLASLEALYLEALRRFPGPFVEYHLSPHAVLADRNGSMTLKGMPVSLLRSIAFARVKHSDWRNCLSRIRYRTSIVSRSNSAEVLRYLLKR